MAFAQLFGIFISEKGGLMSKYRIALKESEEGFAVWVPGLPGCFSQGDTREEALENIRIAIAEYLEAKAEIGLSPERTGE